MFLAVDIGNTNINFGIYNNQSLIDKYKVSSQLENNFEKKLNFLKKFDIQECVICSVVTELNEIITNIINDMFEIKSLLVTSDMHRIIKTDAKIPKEIGADRLANVCASSELYNTPSIVIDAGSAITFDILDSRKVFSGGIIMPGLKIQLKSLSDYTSKLPLLDIENIQKLMGNDTKSSILSGVINGTACALDGLIQKCKNELGDNTVIIGTGGDAEFLQKYMTVKFDYINPNLTLEGIRLIGMKESQIMYNTL